MKHHFIEEVENLNFFYAWKLNSKWNTIELKAENSASDFKSGGEIDFITEHYWAYTKISATKTSEYEVPILLGKPIMLCVLILI
jgi:diaminopimelate decarboxylase